MIGQEGLLKLVDLVRRLRAAQTVVREEGSSCSHLLSPPPTTLTIPLWDQLPPFKRQRLLWLLTQLLERQLTVVPEEEVSDDTGA